MAYVLFVGYVLRREEREGFYAQRFGPVLGFRRFVRRASVVMYHDALAFILLCLVTRNTWVVPFSRTAAASMARMQIPPEIEWQPTRTYTR